VSDIIKQEGQQVKVVDVAEQTYTDGVTVVLITTKPIA
jgi:DNA-binding MurR/RpiR family transcriptional regulator